MLPKAFVNAVESLPTMQHAALLSALQGWPAMMRRKHETEPADEEIWRVVELMVLAAEDMLSDLESQRRKA